MIKKEDCYYLGFVSKTIGVSGEIILQLDTTDPQEYKNLESLFVETNNILTPFFISSISIDNKAFARVKLEGVNNHNSASELIKSAIYLPLSSLPKLSGKAFYYFEVEGFEVIDLKKGVIGTLKEIIDYSNNPLLCITNGTKEILVPKRNNFIEKIDRENQQLFINCPDGLIDFYLNE